MLRDKLKHTKRYQEIINAFLRNGFSHFLFRVGLTERDSRAGQIDDELDMNLRNIGIKLRLALQELGPTFIKLGQIASTRRDLIPIEITRELEKLQDHVEPFPFSEVRRIVEAELGNSLEILFDDFNEVPLATASIGQVHLASLPTGEPLAVKVQRPNIQPTIETDLAILDELSGFLEENTEWAQPYRIRQMIREVALSLRKELDYTTEGRNGERIAQQFNDNPHIYIPKTYWEATTPKVLAMERIDGIKVTQVDRLEVAGYDRKLIAERLVDSMFHQVLVYGFFHGDPHAGNVYILPNNVISYIDFGMVGRLGKEMKYHLASLIIHLRKGDSKGMIRTFTDMELLSNETDLKELEHDLDDLQWSYYDMSFEQLNLGEVLVELFAVARRHQINIPSEITLLGKAILSLENILATLDPDFNIMKAIEPYGEKLLLERFSPLRLAKKSWHRLIENVDVLLHLPKDVKKATQTIQRGKLQLNINVQQVKIILRRFDQISNRLSFSIILLAFSILMTGLIIGSAIAGQKNVIWRMPVIEAGSIIAALMFFYMIVSIFRSGRM
ncbi:AarF/UbiB family protein [Sporosarcina sp. FSL W7-1349]|uniref:ABC1 kinase family protein n=1 Tax=Sporosarcina sp. FSL W7-1349 TaxID=2921561 RepID=UPI0030F7956F